MYNIVRVITCRVSELFVCLVCVRMDENIRVSVNNNGEEGDTREETTACVFLVSTKTIC